ncbi:MAG TPA: sigma-E factor negative regulatory protein [Burkholderiales bacterium]|nr:sigma-E factor negative regulatory protein [Burkholderiales bacterium]
MKDRLSALMDGELDDKSAAEVIQALGSDREAVRAWGTYQLISDAMRQSRVLSEGFTARVAERLAAEPTVLAPRSRMPGFQGESRNWFALSAAASVAAVALVGWLAFAPQPPVAPVAQAPVEAKPNIVPLPTAANDYLLAHQGFSPRVSLQGMAPYVRTVAEHPVEPRK